MDDILDLERCYEQLTAFLESCPMPAARALAIARFCQAIPGDVQGHRVYLFDIGPKLVEALRQDPHGLSDPRHLEAVRSALRGIAACGVLSPDAADLLRNGPAVTLPESKGARVADSNQSEFATTTQVAVPVPLVCGIPVMPDNGEDPEFVAMTVNLTVAGRPGGGAGQVTCHNVNAQRATAELRSVLDVAADARVAARETVHHMASQPSGGAEAATPSAVSFRRYDLRRLDFDLSMPEKRMPIAGGSIGLALAVAMSGIMVGILSGGEAVGPRSDLAWTGVVLPTGEVDSIDRASLSAKARAARVAGLRGLVVPVKLLDVARSVARELGWDGEIYGVANVLEALTRPELRTTLRLSPALVDGCRKPRLWPRLAIGWTAALLMTLIALLPRALDEMGVYWYPPWRPAARLEQMRLLSRRGPEIRVSIPRARDVVLHATGTRAFAFADLSGKLNLESGPGPWLVYGTSLDDPAGEAGYVSAFDLRQRAEVFRYTVSSSGLPLELLDEHVDGRYTVNTGMTADIDNDGKDEIILTASVNPHEHTVLQLLDGSGRLRGAVFHLGHLEHLRAVDVDEDGTVEIMAVGFHNPSDGMSVLTLHADHLYSAASPPVSSSPTRDWDYRAQPCVAHLVIPILPGWTDVSDVTHLGPFSFGLLYPKNGGVLLRVDVGAGVGGLDYLMTIRPPCEVLNITVNSQMADRARALVKSGVPTDFSSPELLQEWQTLFRCSDRIQME